MKKILTVCAVLLTITFNCNGENMNEEFRDAAIYGEINVVNDFIHKDKTVVTATDKYGFTVLHDVIAEHRVEIIELLIFHGANVNAQNDEGIAPLHLAGYDYMVEALLKHGAIIDLESTTGDTPLSNQTAEQDSEEVMEALLKAGANPQHKNKQGDTPIGIANETGEAEKLELLKSYIK